MKRLCKITGTLLFFLLLFNTLQAQNVEFDKANFPGKEKEMKAALKNIRSADGLVKTRYPNYRKALPLYREAAAFNPNNASLNYKIGYCYYKTKDYKKAISYLEKAQSLNPGVDKELKLLLARCYHAGYEFDKATDMFIQFRQSLDPEGISQYEKAIKKELAECKTGKELVAHPVRVMMTNLGKNVNSPFPDYSPVITADRSALYFTSMRPTTTGGMIDQTRGRYFEDIYYTLKDSTGRWSKALNPGPPLNTKNHDAVVGLSPDGQQIYIYKGENDGNIFTSKLQGETWEKPVSLGKNINSPYHESSASFSYDFLTIYFVSNREGGYGGHDIYLSKKDEKGRWGEAVNLGGDINTPYDEAAIFAHPDGKTFYFSSKGHNTMGGYDIFKITYENGQWSEAQNLGYPINTTGDDLFFSISADGKYGYYASQRDDSRGSLDIYEISFLGEEKPLISNTEDNLLAFRNSGVRENMIEEKENISKVDLLILKGTITDEFSGKPLPAKLELIDLQTNKSIATFDNNSASGKYLISLPAGKNYGINVTSDNCMFYSDNVDLSNKQGFKEVIKDIKLKHIAVGSSIVLNNIFFSSGKATLKKESETELQHLVKLLNDYPKMKIEISGHTDNVGSAKFNKNLSEKRAKAVVDYLIAQGIDKNRLTYVGYGFDKPVASNDTPEGRKQNRRTEFKIIEN